MSQSGATASTAEFDGRGIMCVHEKRPRAATNDRGHGTEGMTSMQAQRISRALTDEANADRPVYMVLRHLGVEPQVAVNALFGAGLKPSEYSLLCSDLTAERVEKIAEGLS